ncbi:hypothetical protein [Altericroceibacterium endophyticum]|uniref:Lipoprotein n=1 Tax=Altericroceibacterium endophyticum TaxID=1808508 RepID=A0A6I4T5H7_9SPHN|nr:hypothetical protein [Altericroceibacterium endophyticum]MXO64985.1 hypothetical protein [Altericroceibacterium endophyticum]
MRLRSFRPLLLAALPVALSACAAQPGPVHTRLYPEQAVFNAAQVAPRPVFGVFDMAVRATGRDKSRLYLNSQTDYRDPRCLTIVITPKVEQALIRRLGGDVEKALLGQRIAVQGAARTVRIDFTTYGRPSGKYYYQTHVVLNRAEDLTIGG